MSNRTSISQCLPIVSCMNSWYVISNFWKIQFPENVYTVYKVGIDNPFTNAHMPIKEIYIHNVKYIYYGICSSLLSMANTTVNIAFHNIFIVQFVQNYLQTIIVQNFIVLLQFIHTICKSYSTLKIPFSRWFRKPNHILGFKIFFLW